MKTVQKERITQAVRDLCITAATQLPRDVFGSLESYHTTESAPLAKSILAQCIENARIAQDENLPMCQDTGFSVLFIEKGRNYDIDDLTLEEACQEGIARGYTEGYLRKSIVTDPLFDRTNTGDNTPAVIHIEHVEGSSLKITLAPKGGGSENMSKTAMLKPADGEAGVIDFVSRSVIEAGGNPCPPTIVGVGIGGTFEKCCQIAKKSLLRPLGKPHDDPRYARLEKKILEKINSSGVGPQGLGGDTTALAVHIETHPCHIAQLPVAVNLNCHAARHAEVIL
jgi:fumarate hydratase subunit alpha